MALPTPRSINSQLTRLMVVAFSMLVVSLAVAATVAYSSVRRWEAKLVPRVSHAVGRLFERQAEETRRQVEEHIQGRDAADVVRDHSTPAARRQFTAEMANELARYGYDFVVVADAADRATHTWTVTEGTGGRVPAFPRELFQLIDSVGTVSGYIRVGNDVQLVGGGVLGAAGVRGPAYLLIGHPMDAQHLAALGADVSAKLALRIDGTPPAAPVTVNTAGGDSVVFRQPLPGLFGSPVGTVEAMFERKELPALKRWGALSIAVLLALGALVLWLVWSRGHRLLVEPVRAMAREVEAMRRSRALHEISGEVAAQEWEVLRSTFNETVRTLHDWQRRYRDVFDRAADALFLIEPTTGRVIDANPATAVLTGIAPEAMIGNPLPDALLPGETGQRVVRWRRPDGVTQTWGVAASQIALENGPCTLAAYRDLTGREAMAHAQKMDAVGSLAGGIAHDFNNLLGAVLTGATAARAMLPPEHAALVAIEGIEHAGTRAAELTRQLLSFSRHDPLRLAPVDLAQAVTSVGRICSRTFDRRIVVDAWTPSDLPEVLGDAGEIEQALLNLCINSRDAMPDGGSLRIEGRREELNAEQARAAGVVQPGTYVAVMVSDTGEGMADEVKARLFEPFFTTKETGKGTGLGLSLVYSLMRQLGGSVAVRSAEQRGTRVTLLFPSLGMHAERPVRSSAAAITVAPRRTPMAGVRRPVVLLIDDERALREMMRLVLDLSGFDVIEAADGTEGVARLTEHRAVIRVILLDVQLPGALSGADTLAAIRAIDPDVPVVLCTGFVRDEELARMRMLTVDRVLLKPVDINALVARLDELARDTPAPAEG